jgi:cellulose biosynthesis protein BcsQ
MPRAKRRTPKNLDVGSISSILVELDSLLEAFDDEDPEDIEYRLDALTTMFLKARLVHRTRLRRLKFHVVIEELAIEVPERDTLSEEMETFQDLINGYGDEPSEEEMDEAREILERVVGALKAAFQGYVNKNQLRLDLER